MGGNNLVPPLVGLTVLSEAHDEQPIAFGIGSRLRNGCSQERLALGECEYGRVQVSAVGGKV
jgi:hypothetical protein